MTTTIRENLTFSMILNFLVILNSALLWKWHRKP